MASVIIAGNTPPTHLIWTWADRDRQYALQQQAIVLMTMVAAQDRMGHGSGHLYWAGLWRGTPSGCGLHCLADCLGT